MRLPGKDLTKSRYLSAHQCKKRLWLELRSEVEPAPETEASFRRKKEGLRVGELAREHRGEGVLINEVISEQAVLATKAAIKRGANRIFEGAFSSDELLVRVDILERREDKTWDIIEVKSALVHGSRGKVD